MKRIHDSSAIQHVTWLRTLAVGLGLGSLALLAPIVWLAASGGIGLLVLGSTLVVGFAAVQTLPLLGQRLENAILASRKAEARRNPIAQLQNEVLRRSARLSLFRQALVTVGGQIESISQMLAERQHRDPNHVLARQERALERLQQFHSINLGRLVQSQGALEEFRCTVERKESEWRIALAIDDASELLGPNATDNLMQDLLTDSALRSVQDRFNSVFAELDVQMSSITGPTRTLLDEKALDRMDALHLPEQLVTRSDL
jgi:hypothetical protein